MADGKDEQVVMSRSELLKVLDIVRSWQHKNEAHIRGCPSTTYYAGLCSDKCRTAMRLVGEMTPQEIERLPVSGHEFARSSISAY